MAEADRPGQAGENEGEGSRSADEQYRAGVQEHLRKGDVEREAQEAQREVEAKPEEYRHAEEEGKSRSAGEAPGDAEKI